MSTTQEIQNHSIHYGEWNRSKIFSDIINFSTNKSIPNIKVSFQSLFKITLNNNFFQRFLPQWLNIQIFQTLGTVTVYKRTEDDILSPLTRVNIIPMTIGIKMKLRVVTCSRQQSWSGLLWTSWYWMGGCSPSMHLLFNLGDCFLNLKLNSHIGSCLFPTIFLHQKSKHCKKIKITFLLLALKPAMAPMLRFYFGTDRNPHILPPHPPIWHWCNMRRDNPKAIQ